MPDHFQVKSRTANPLKNFWPEYEIEVIDWADYRFRTVSYTHLTLPTKA